jgi:hypothetical protein
MRRTYSDVKDYIRISWNGEISNNVGQPPYTKRGTKFNETSRIPAKKVDCNDK